MCSCTHGVHVHTTICVRREREGARRSAGREKERKAGSATGRPAARKRLQLRRKHREPLRRGKRQRRRATEEEKSPLIRDLTETSMPMTTTSRPPMSTRRSPYFIASGLARIKTTTTSLHSNSNGGSQSPTTANGIVQVIDVSCASSRGPRERVWHMDQSPGRMRREGWNHVRVPWCNQTPCTAPGTAQQVSTSETRTLPADR